MNAETKSCKNCKASFAIESEDFDFYERIKVPPPTWCPRCRLIRKMVWRNDHFLFKKADVHGKEIFSSFPKEIDINIVDSKEWMGDGWDQNASAMEYDWTKPFLLQFKELLGRAPAQSRSIINLVNSDYSNNATDLKNCYLVFGSSHSEDSLYSENLYHSVQCVDTSSSRNAEISYECFMNERCYRAFFSSLCEDCHDIYFSRDCIGCSNCFGCVGLRKKSYYFFNEPCTKEEYEKKLAAADLGSRTAAERWAREAKEFWLKHPVRYAQNYRNTNVTGEYITNSRNVSKSYSVNDSENLKYCYFLFGGKARDSYDHYRFGDNTELIYESGSTVNDCSRIFFCYQCFSNSSDLFYSYCLTACSNCFGCVGLHNKQYCILNKQYSKEEYLALVPKIMKHMNDMPYTDPQGRTYAFGEFFPLEFAPEPYNVSIAHEFFPLTKEAALKEGFRWHDGEERNYAITVRAGEIPDRIGDASDAITRDIIECAHKNACGHPCTTAFRIVPEELSFYRHFNIPIPAFCPNCRYFERIAQRNPISFWQRQCMCRQTHSRHAGQCPNSFETAFAPERPDIVYCEECYQEEFS